VALRQRHQKDEDKAAVQAKLAGTVTVFTGSMALVYVHLAILPVWVAANLSLPLMIRRFDQTFVILATAASVEAIFLSTFVLISQNRPGR